jgi:hypothetical protein
MRILLFSGFFLLQVAGGAGWALAQQTPVIAAAPSDAEATALRERAAEFWAARVSGDAEKQWQLLEPRGKGRISAQEYGASPTGGKYLAYKVEDAVIKGYFATVKVRLLVQQYIQAPGPPPPLVPQTTVVEDGWVRIRGVWYRRFDDGAKAIPQTREPG